MRSIFISAAMTLTTVIPAAADFKVRMPDANPGEIAIEPLGDYGHDPNPAHSGELSFVQEFEYGVNGFWRTEIELEQNRDAGLGQSFKFNQVTSENFFQFTERGEYWLDTGFFAEFDAGGTHNGWLSPAELRLVAEWIDIGAQYYNDPFAIPVAAN